MNRNNLIKGFKDLITIEDKQLWGLVTATRDKRQRWQADYDYIDTLREQMSSSDPIEAQKAKEALTFLNAFTLANVDGNFAHLESIGVSASDEFKRNVYNSRNASQRDYVSNNQGAQDELSDFINPTSAFTLGEAMDAMKAYKRKIRKTKKEK